MAEPELIIDHSDRAVANLTHSMQRGGDVELLVRVFVDQVQELEATFYDLVVAYLLDTATGEQLDTLGAIVGESREGLGDVDFRAFIRARILTNLAEGEIDRILTVLRLITSATSVRYQPLYPAAFLVEYVRDGYASPELEQRFKRQVELITPSGVGFEVVRATTGYFGFESDPDALGFGEGEFASIL